LAERLPLPAHPPSYDDVARAAQQISGVAHRTPVVTSRSFNERAKAEVFFKTENLQRAGAFKFRGAYNALSQLPPDARRRGVVTFSSGNHAQAVALAGRLLGIPRTIVMPSDAPAIKRDATLGYGADIVYYDRSRENRESIGRSLAETRGATLIPPFDHPHVIAGQGTAAKELFEDVGPLDALLVPCGGGGLLAGSALAASALSPGCRVIGVEPLAGNDGVRSFETRTLQTIADPRTVADGARTPSLGQLTFAIILEHVAGMTAVSDPPLLRAMFYLWERLKLLVEPTGALGAAALLEESLPQAASGAQRIGVILSGGNVDLSQINAWRAAL
jgi:threonine dehydratase